MNNPEEQCLMNALLRVALVVAVFVSLADQLVDAQEKGKPAPEEQTGLQVGASAPRFVLKDQNGRERSLDEMLKKGKIALVFYRSADW
jgi:cytochrome oxidase Cu insertion factor (SCO1/SenC/PrrC family)